MILNLQDIILLNAVHKDLGARKVKNQFHDNDDDVIESKNQLSDKCKDASQGVIDQDELKWVKIYMLLSSIGE
jgi:hypothetical protein